MSKYGEAAVACVTDRNGENIDVRIAWEKQMSRLFNGKPAAQKKGCPKNAFLGLCEAGFVEGIPGGKYGVRKKSKNKSYATAAAKAILSHKHFSKNELWDIARLDVDKPAKNENNQMDVVIALYSHTPCLLKLPENFHDSM